MSQCLTPAEIEGLLADTLPLEKKAAPCSLVPRLGERPCQGQPQSLGLDLRYGIREHDDVSTHQQRDFTGLFRSTFRAHRLASWCSPIPLRRSM